MIRITISPAKKMNMTDDFPTEATKPLFPEQTAAILEYLQRQDYESLKQIWKCSDVIAKQNVEQLQAFDRMGYRYRAERSDERTMVFAK